MTENFANSYQTTLAADLTAAAATLTVASATGAPAPQFRLLIDAEIVLVTAVAGVTYSVTRGVEGTTAASHTASAVVSHVVTAGALDQLRADAPHVIQDEGVALTARPALNLIGEHVAATDDAAGARTNVTVAVPDATPTAHGLLLAADKSKLDGVAAGAQVNVLEGVTGTAPIVAGAIAAKSQALSITPATGAAPGSMSAADKAKLDGYPATPGLDGHTIQDEGVALAQRAGLNFVGPALTVTDDSAGNRSVVTLPTASATVEGSLSAADKGKLDGVAAGAQVNVLEGIDATAPVTVSAIAAKRQTVGIVAASASVAGSMSAADKARLDTIGAYRVRVRNSAAISIPNSAITYLTFDTEIFDTDTMHDPTTNPDRITFTHAGAYLVGAGFWWASSTAGADRTSALELTSAGVTKTMLYQRQGPDAGNVALSVSTLIYANAGDYIRHWVYQNTGAALDIQASDQFTPVFWAVSFGS